MRKNYVSLLIAGCLLAQVCTAESLLLNYSFDGSIADPNLLAADSSGNNWISTTTGNPVGSTDVPTYLAGGNSWYGDNDWIDVDPNMPVPTSYTVAFWAKVDSQNARIVATGNPEADGVVIWQRAGGNFRLYHKNTNIITEAEAGIVYPTAQWVHVAVTVDSTTLNVCLYVNGVTRVSKTVSSLAALTKGINRIGARMTGTTYNYKGFLDDVRFYDYALTLQQVKALIGIDNTPPQPEAGGYGQVQSMTGFYTAGVNSPFQLDGIYDDDGKPAGGTVTAQWSVVDAAQEPNVVFSNSNILNPTVTFDTPGFYRLRLTAGDGELFGSDEVLFRAKEATNTLQAHLQFDGDPNFIDDDFYRYTTITGTPTFVPGVVGKAIKLAAGDNVKFGKQIGAETSISVALWVAPDPSQVANGAYPALKRTNSTASLEGGWAFETRPGLMYQYFSPGFNNGAGRLEYAATWSGQWMHLVATYDAATGAQILYVDGQQVASRTSWFTSFDSASDMQLGTGNWAGLIDDMYIYDYVIDAAKVRELFTEGGNAAPIVTVPTQQTKIILPVNQTSVSGTVYDENSYTVLWTVVDQPAGATVMFSSPASLNTTATFNTPGNYTLRLTAADDGGLSSYADTVVKVRPAGFDGMEAHITFNGLSANNTAPNGLSYTGILNGGASFSSDPNRPGLGDGLQLDGTGYVVYDKYLGSDPQMTVCYWAKPSVLAESYILDKFPGGSSGLGWMSRLRAVDFNLATTIGSSFNSGADLRYPVELALTAGQWVHVAMTFDGTTCTLYQNGIKVGVHDIDYSTATLAVPLVVGCRYSNDTSFFTGAVDELRIYDYALSSEQIKTIYANDGGQAINTCFPGLTGDLNQDCYVNLHDLAVLASEWISSYSLPDLAVVAEHWLSCNDLDMDKCD